MLRRLVPATAVATLLIAGLTGCGAQQSQASDCLAPMSSGALSNNVTVLGEFGTAPEVSVPKDIEISETQRTIVSEAEDRSRVAEEGSLVSVNMAFFDAASGDQLYASPVFSGQGTSPEFLLVAKDTANPLSEGVRCAAAGDRVVLAIAPEEGAEIAAQLGGTADSAVVAVLDVVTTSPLAANGAVQGLPSGYPAVVTNDEGRPGIVLPPREAPEGISSASRIVGDGAKVTAENNVVGQVLSVGWDGEQRTNTWESGLVALGTEEQIAQSGFTFRGELTGKTVGSQVVIIDNSTGDPQVVVVDILGVS